MTDARKVLEDAADLLLEAAREAHTHSPSAEHRVPATGWGLMRYEECAATLCTEAHDKAAALREMAGGADGK